MSNPPHRQSSGPPVNSAVGSSTAATDAVPTEPTQHLPAVSVRSNESSPPFVRHSITRRPTRSRGTNHVTAVTSARYSTAGANTPHSASAVRIPAASTPPPTRVSEFSRKIIISMHQFRAIVLLYFETTTWSMS